VAADVHRLSALVELREAETTKAESAMQEEDARRTEEEAHRQRRQAGGGARANVRVRAAPAQTQTQTVEKEKKKTKKKQTKKKKKVPKAKKPALKNALFKNAGTAVRLGFAIDISGSMSAGTPMGTRRIDVVKQHLASLLRSMAGVKHAAFGIVCPAFPCKIHAVRTYIYLYGAMTYISYREGCGYTTLETPEQVLFNNSASTTAAGRSLLPASASNIELGVRAIEGIEAGGGNGGEAAAMDMLIQMRPQAIFFLGDGGCK
jgi:hypothetical protein